MIIILASGPSVTDEQIELTRGQNVMTINNMAFVAPWAQRHFSGDRRWWDKYHDRVKSPAKYTLSTVAANSYGLTYVGQPTDTTTGASFQLGKIGRSGNSGFQAVNLAYLLGYRRIILVGFDHQHTGGKAHCHEDHPEGWPNAEGLKIWNEKSPIIARDLIAAGCEIINCSIDTALSTDVIKRSDLKHAIEQN